ncbi:MAG: hypothetical protein JWO67_4623 [Streptosporangiaceae bacterium]|jgi:hypothetical protein|nr:hypothetical protein [Streptosporangiaceae bacterium]
MTSESSPGQDNGSKPRDEMADDDQAREALGDTAQTPGAKWDVTGRLKAKVAQTTDAVTELIEEPVGRAAKTTQDKVAQATGQVTELASRARETAESPEQATSAVRRVGAAAGGLAAVLSVVWLWRRRARRNRQSEERGGPGPQTPDEEQATRGEAGPEDRP